MPPDEKRVAYLGRLRDQLVQYFVMDEFIVLCTDMGLPHEELRPGGFAVQADELVQRLEDRGKIPELVAYCADKRPNVSWDDPLALGSVLTETEDELRGNLARFGASFQSALQQIDVLSDYKDLHDYLHDLQFGWFPLVQEKVKGLPDAKGAIQDLRGYEREFRTAIGKLNDTLSNKKVPEAEGVWIKQLEEARQHLRLGISTPEPDMKLIGAAVQSIGQVLDTQPTYINGDLMRAVGALRLPELKNIVQLVLDKLIARAANAEIIKQFEQGIVDLSQMNSDLDALMEEHDIWQANEGKIPMMLITLESLAVFTILWQQLKDKTSRLYTNKPEEWATDLQGDEASLDQAIKDNSVDSAREAFNWFYKDAKQRFWDVDKLIKKKCKELSEIRSKMPDKRLA
ncbi:MAG: hypothetical protein ABI923_00635 [bacterium]